MQIPSYQIHKILQIYVEQFSRLKDAENAEGSSRNKPGRGNGKNTIGDGKRRAIINKVVDNIVSENTQFPKMQSKNMMMPASPEPSDGGSVESAGVPEQKEFVFNSIESGEMKTNSMCVEDLWQQLNDSKPEE